MNKSVQRAERELNEESLRRTICRRENWRRIKGIVDLGGTSSETYQLVEVGGDLFGPVTPEGNLTYWGRGQTYRQHTKTLGEYYVNLRGENVRLEPATTTDFLNFINREGGKHARSIVDGIRHGTTIFGTAVKTEDGFYVNPPLRKDGTPITDLRTLEKCLRSGIRLGSGKEEIRLASDSSMARHLGFGQYGILEEQMLALLTHDATNPYRNFSNITGRQINDRLVIDSSMDVTLPPRDKKINIYGLEKKPKTDEPEIMLIALSLDPVGYDTDVHFVQPNPDNFRGRLYGPRFFLAKVKKGP